MVIITPAGYGGKWWPGVTGSETIVRDAVAKWRKGWIPPVTTAARLPSVSRVSRWLMPRRIIRGEENYAFRFISLMCEKRTGVENSAATGTRVLPYSENLK